VVSKAEAFREHADECRPQAEWSRTPADKKRWLKIAENLRSVSGWPHIRLRAALHLRSGRHFARGRLAANRANWAK
jgi:hypothetical protein